MAKMSWQKGKKESYLATYFVFLLFDLVGLTLQINVWILIGSVGLFCTICGWIVSNNYRFHTKNLKEISLKNSAILTLKRFKF